MAGFWSRLSAGLAKTRTALTERLQEIVPLGGKVKEETLTELEEILLGSDVGVTVAEDLLAAVRRERVGSAAGLRAALAKRLEELLAEGHTPLAAAVEPPLTILVVGVNGAGKTTSIAKLAARYRREGKKVILAACDTFRAAAADQLAVWAQRTGAELIQHQEGSDPAAVAYDALQAALARRADVLIVDTAGRLQTKKNLMAELGKIHRVLNRVRPDLPQEVLLVLDATTGQNALSQARLFRETVPLTGVILAKLDGTAKGGIAVAVQRDLGLPIKLIGVGEGMDDLADFQPAAFVAALLGEASPEAEA
ncbi:signal recognition particle-docking protein FtsY [Gelria sp. Kuro-4]|uniref:signal recognition particle-docking protein FtsY n=1 Tax=Gelria sp. Kuro-4 TaxID=2796927 RepID=UPI001BF0FF87|nr:signal recognition particle-docking protein FtsY [Gelria sp. Kuro-4]BCV24793.1 signal recognition particle receptor FtsY [Gelria sp. Kuro-4]